MFVMFDPEKRKIVMGRSRKLGHCICNPKEPCPCDLFKDKNVCLCAGERLPDMPKEVRLTDYVESAGCASKINQDDLKKALAGLPAISDENVLVSADTADDAGIYKMSDEMALVQSVDVFTPNVDDPYNFGQIAAANSVSDIYAMGGKPLSALSIIGFPIDRLDHGIMNQILKGGIDKMKEAGVAVIGGHSIKDNELKFGFAVTGTIHPDFVITNDRARVGDVLILTKPLGTGVISFANQLGKAFPFNIAAISRSMSELNKTAAEVMIDMGVKTATDVTGFGLMGHLAEMVNQSGVTAEVYADCVPLFEDVLDFVKMDMISGAVERNRDYAKSYVTKDSQVSFEWETILYDPQTSGGLLIAVKEEKKEETLKRLKENGVEFAAAIGKVVAESDGKIILRKGSNS
jgi:selenide,water dikinase